MYTLSGLLFMFNSIHFTYTTHCFVQCGLYARACRSYTQMLGNKVAYRLDPLVPVLETLLLYQHVSKTVR
jgi:hypothetical protein